MGLALVQYDLKLCGLKRKEREAGHLKTCSAEDKNALRFTSTASTFGSCAARTRRRGNGHSDRAQRIGRGLSAAQPPDILTVCPHTLSLSGSWAQERLYPCAVLQELVGCAIHF